MTLRMLVLVLSAFLMGSPSWASTGWCLGQGDLSSGCTSTNIQFVNMLLPQNSTLQNVSVFSFQQQPQDSSSISSTASYSNITSPNVFLSPASDTTYVAPVSYSISQLQSVLTVPSFSVGFTSNNTSMQSNQVLQQFNALLTGTVTYSLSSGGCSNTQSIMCNSNLALQFLSGNSSGTGSSTNFVSTFSSAGLNSTSALQFLMSDHSDVSGSQQFISIIGAPEPGTFGLMAGALAMLGLLALRRNRAAA